MFSMFADCPHNVDFQPHPARALTQSPGGELGNLHFHTLSSDSSHEASLASTAGTHPGHPILGPSVAAGELPSLASHPPYPQPILMLPPFPLRRLRPSALCFLKFPTLHPKHSTFPIFPPGSLRLTSLPASGHPALLPTHLLWHIALHYPLSHAVSV